MHFSQHDPAGFNAEYGVENANADHDDAIAGGPAQLSKTGKKEQQRG